VKSEVPSDDLSYKSIAGCATADAYLRSWIEPALMSSYLTRDERLDLQEDDDGDPDETVFVETGSKVTHYHDDLDCRVAASADSMSRSAA